MRDPGDPTTLPPSLTQSSSRPFRTRFFSSLSSMWPSLSENEKKRTSVPQPFYAYVGGTASDGWMTARPLSETPQSYAPPQPLPPENPKLDPNGAHETTSTIAPNAPAVTGTITARQHEDDNSPGVQDHGPPDQIQEILTSVHVLSWNIDFSVLEEVPRTETALSYMFSIVQQIPESAAVVIFLQEMTSHKLRVIRQTPWVRDRFYMTDESSGFWISSYGTTILVDRRLVISGEGVHRLRLVSEFGRDGLFVDLLVRPVDNDKQHEGPDANQDKILRLCNVHLESLASNPPRRPAQFAAIAPLLQPSATIHASIMAGDTNANQPYDATLPSENNLVDTYLSLGGTEGAADGHTWGYQSGRTRFPPKRMDKILYMGGIEATKLDRLGVGVMVEDVGARTRLKDFGEQEYVTDHYGLWGRFEIGNGFGLVSAKGAWRQCCAPNQCACGSPGAFDPAYGLIQ